jgi:hypothetical protein
MPRQPVRSSGLPGTGSTLAETWIGIPEDRAYGGAGSVRPPVTNGVPGGLSDRPAVAGSAEGPSRGASTVVKRGVPPRRLAA